MMTVAKKMNDGVAMLLERMKTNPEEFAGDSPTKWKNLVENYRPYLEANELKLLDDGMKELMRQRFTEKVIGEIIEPNTKPIREGSWGDSALDAAAYQKEQMRLHLDAHKAVLGQTPIAGVTQTI
jgi:hypothetical protein